MSTTAPPSAHRAVRPPPPPERLTSALHLSDLMSQLGDLDAAVRDLVEGSSGLRLEHVRLLRSLATGRQTLDALHHSWTGQPATFDEALADLEDRGLATRLSGPTGQDLVGATELGRAAVDQLGALLILAHARSSQVEQAQLIAAARLLTSHVHQIVEEIPRITALDQPSR